MCQEVVETAEEPSCYSLLIAVSSYSGPYCCLSTAGGVNVSKWECEYKKTRKIFGNNFFSFFWYKVIAIYICIHRLFHFFPPFFFSFHNKLELHLREKKGTPSKQDIFQNYTLFYSHNYRVSCANCMSRNIKEELRRSMPSCVGPSAYVIICTNFAANQH